MIYFGDKQIQRDKIKIGNTFIKHIHVGDKMVYTTDFVSSEIISGGYPLNSGYTNTVLRIGNYTENTIYIYIAYQFNTNDYPNFLTLKATDGNSTIETYYANYLYDGYYFSHDTANSMAYIELESGNSVNINIYRDSGVSDNWTSYLAYSNDAINPNSYNQTFDYKLITI